MVSFSISVFCFRFSFCVFRFVFFCFLLTVFVGYSATCCGPWPAHGLAFVCSSVQWLSSCTFKEMHWGSFSCGGKLSLQIEAGNRFESESDWQLKRCRIWLQLERPKCHQQQQQQLQQVSYIICKNSGKKLSFVHFSSAFCLRPRDMSFCDIFLHFPRFTSLSTVSTVGVYCCCCCCCW